MTSRHISRFSFVAALLVPSMALAGGGGGDDHVVIHNIAVCLIAASVLGFAMKLLRQPLLLGYILAGVAIGPIGLQFITDYNDIITVAEIGLILLLFMIGLEIDLKQMKAAGKWVIVPGLLQFPICVLTGYGAFYLLEKVGIDVGTGSYARLYAAIAIGISDHHQLSFLTLV